MGPAPAPRKTLAATALEIARAAIDLRLRPGDEGRQAIDADIIRDDRLWLRLKLRLRTMLAMAGVLAGLMLLARLASARVFRAEILPVALYALGVIALGLIDDSFGGQRGGEAAPRGWREHAAAALRGELSTGMLKAAGSLGLALPARAKAGRRCSNALGLSSAASW